MILLIDNYDSFSYNLYQYVGEITKDIKVIRNDELSVDEIEALKPERIIISPGPGRPEDAGVIIDVVKSLGNRIPILGVCLGHQAICAAYGADIIHAKKLMHGKQSTVALDSTCPIFKGLGCETKVARYHSLAADENTMPECLKVTATADDGQIMAIMHKTYPIYGVQFHPESIMTPDGMKMLINFINSDDIKTKTQPEKEKLTVAYSGIRGAFANIAAQRLFPDAKLVSYKNFKEAYNAVVKGQCDRAVLPTENSYAGEVGQVLDLMYEGDLYIDGVYPLRISQNLLGIKGSRIENIKKVMSHPHALEQCDEFITSHHLERIEAVNTAIAAKQVADLNDMSIAAIASIDTAKLYGLEILKENINEDTFNTTKFAVLSRNRNAKKNDTSLILMFAVKNEAGMLAKAIDVIGRHGFSMNALRSRHLKSLSWQYYFYAEIEGDPESDEISRMLSEMSQYCVSLKQLGTTGENPNELI